MKTTAIETALHAAGYPKAHVAVAQIGRNIRLRILSAGVTPEVVIAIAAEAAGISRGRIDVAIYR